MARPNRVVRRNFKMVAIRTIDRAREVLGRNNYKIRDYNWGLKAIIKKLKKELKRKHVVS